jgi:hypothetical protein
MKIRAFWDVARCSLGVDRRFKGAYCLYHQGDSDGGSTHLWNIGLLQADGGGSTHLWNVRLLQADYGGSTHFWNVSLLQRDYRALRARRL